MAPCGWERARVCIAWIGRLAAYPMMAMRAGMIGIAAADSGRSPKHVAPFGGREARLGTNPISIAVPSDLEAPFYLDMATSAVAAGKIALSIARGEQILVKAEDNLGDLGLEVGAALADAAGQPEA